MMINEEQRLGLLASHSSATMQSLWSLASFFGWSAESESQLEFVERKILSKVQQPMQSRYVPISENSRIWTLCFNSSSGNSSSTSPLVLLHGIGSCAALWALNIDELASGRPVYIIDLLGFGRSSRTTFSNDPVIAEMEMVEAIDAWRHEIGLDKFVLLGHCFGGYLATAYAIRYPDNIRHLILVDPWGFTDSSTVKSHIELPAWIKMIMLAIQPFNPLAALRVAGSWGPALVALFKPDLIQKYSALLSDDTIAQYIYQCNAPNPTGETAFKHMSHDFGYAVYPMIHRVKDIPMSVSLTTIFGSRSWVDSNIGQQIKDQRPESYVDVQIIRGAGHFVFADKAELFNGVVLKTCTLVDHRLDNLTPLTRDRRRRRLKSDSAPNLCALEQRARRNPRGGASSSAIERRSRHNSDRLAEEEGEEQGDGLMEEMREGEAAPASEAGGGFKPAKFVVSEED